MPLTSTWATSSHSGANGCVEVMYGRAVAVRDSKMADSPILAFDPARWAEFVAAVTSGELAQS